MQNRRSFIKQSCALCISAIGLGAVVSQLSSCAPIIVFKGEIQQKKISVPFSTFTEFNNMLIVRNNQLSFDILLIKKSDGTFTALEMKCSHQDNPLTVNKTGLFCASHGSSFDFDGKVLKEPALLPIKKYNVEIENLIVQIIL